MPGENFSRCLHRGHFPTVDILGIVVGVLQSGQSIVTPAPASSATRWLPHDPHLKKMKMSGITNLG
jgi:hypothetical protein